MLPEPIARALSEADYIVGSDECGYGAWAGPLVVCAAVVSKDWPLANLVKDSKAFKGANAESAREKVAKQILPKLVYAVVSISVEEIDRHGVYKVLTQAHGKAIEQVIAKHTDLGVVGKHAVVVDGTLKVTYSGQQAMALPKADGLVPAVSAASIIGKVARDRHMTQLGAKYPGYGFASNKGYGGNPEHDAGLEKLGICEIHRKSYEPIKKYVQTSDEPLMLWAMGGDDE